MHEKILRELDRCKAKLDKIRASIGKEGAESKDKAVYMAGCALILQYFALEVIETSIF